MNFTVDI